MVAATPRSAREGATGNLRSELPTDTSPSVIQSVTTDENFSVRNSVGRYQRKYSVGFYRRHYGRKSFRIKKKAGRWRGGFGGSFIFRRHHRWIQKRQPVQWRDRCAVYITDGLTEGFEMAYPYGDVPMFPSESQTWSLTIHRRNIRRWLRKEKLIYVSSADPLLPYFSFFFPNPNSPHMQTTSPPPPQKKVFLIPAQQVIFLEVL